jgi:CheY-like chemotaxis protein
MVKPLRTLVVDDDADIRDSLVTLLELLGCESSSVGRGEDALRVLVEGTAEVHVAFVDVSMPGMNGYDLARAYRRAAPHKIHTTLVATTGWGTEKDRDRALREGFDIHLVKPVDMAQLRLVLDAVRSRHTLDGDAQDLRY